MNVYTTICEARGCLAGLHYQSADWDAAIDYVRSQGWTAKEREGGCESFCPKHKELASANTTGGDATR